ncbi:Zn2 Cys6 DNA-binding protein [Fusarium mexicanum]|uniref:Zn2 Cys6 DNA-binding protein n=1 Tax=Fusarium mexicanum TaxID=751941 RepID=A0A8H5II20_9HYPO|nr:Zn2 Cys6 DNA-binding protein [Fusarium mexicanum]
MRTSSGCWTCRIRRKKCDELRPVCKVCAALNITCYFDPTKPPWMDGGAKQDEMMNNIKLEIKARSRRSNPRQINRAEYRTTSTSDITVFRSSDPTSGLGDDIIAPSDPADSAISATEWLPSPDSGSVGSLSSTQVEPRAAHTPPLDPISTTFYLDHVFSYLYPFYRPSSRRGGRSWILELLMTSSAFQQIVLSYSTYYYDLAAPQNGRTQVDKLHQAESSVASLSQSMQTLLSVGSLDGHTHCACRVLTSIVQHHRYEIATANSNWKIHFDGALALFTRLLDRYSSAVESLHHSSTRAGFNAIVHDLNVPMQEAFIFSVGLMLFDDIVAAASSNQEPQLFQYHQHLLGGDDPALELEVIIGVKSCILRLLGQVASLNAKKHQDQAAGNLDELELAQHASTIMESLTASIEQLQESSSPSSNPQSGERDYLEELRAHYDSRDRARDTGLVSQTWAHATMVYLITVVSGWQPANAILRHHIDQIVQLLTGQIPIPLIRTIVWPLCVAGCLADPPQRRVLLGVLGTLQPITLFSSVHKSVMIMERTWQRGSGFQSGNQPVMNNIGLATFFQMQGNLLLLI